jgi:hypothetical protein
MQAGVRIMYGALRKSLSSYLNLGLLAVHGEECEEHLLL